MSNYQKALSRGKHTGAARADDQALMAMLLDATGHILIGAVSPELVWEGAVKKGLNSKQLAKLISDNPMNAAELMWE